MSICENFDEIVFIIVFVLQLIGFIYLVTQFRNFYALITPIIVICYFGYHAVNIIYQRVTANSVNQSKSTENVKLEEYFIFGLKGLQGMQKRSITKIGTVAKIQDKLHVYTYKDYNLLVIIAIYVLLVSSSLLFLKSACQGNKENQPFWLLNNTCAFYSTCFESYFDFFSTFWTIAFLSPILAFEDIIKGVQIIMTGSMIVLGWYYSHYYDKISFGLFGTRTKFNSLTDLIESGYNRDSCIKFVLDSILDNKLYPDSSFVLYQYSSGPFKFNQKITLGNLVDCGYCYFMQSNKHFFYHKEIRSLCMINERILSVFDGIDTEEINIPDVLFENMIPMTMADIEVKISNL
eukprot:NODE_451_length_7265_cov_0.799609.p3 type:complete len:348 gc:universal NODE_451_length_7265_cov_0.799609:4585-5628(+)